MEEKSPKTSDELALERTNLAYDRTALANDRTLMAWVRTATSLISFGFTIYKFFQEMVNAKEANVSHTLLTPRRVGLLLVMFGFLGLLLATIQYKIDDKRLRSQYNKLPRTFTPMIATLILILGLILMLGIIFRQ